MRRPAGRPAARRSAWLASFASLLFSGCGKEPRLPAGFTSMRAAELPSRMQLPPIVTDLFDDFPGARKEVETARIDFQSAGAGEHLLEGWSWSRAAGPNGVTWMTGTRSGLRFRVGEPRPLELSFRCWPLDWPGAPPQVLDFVLNGERVGSIELSAGIQDRALQLPAERLRAGENILILEASRSDRPLDVIDGSADARSLAVAFQHIQFLGAAAGVHLPESGRSDAGPVVRLPAGAAVTYHLELERDSVLFLAGCTPVGPDASQAVRLEIALEEEGAAAERVLALPLRGAAHGPLAVRLPQLGSGFARLELRAVCAPGSAPVLELLRPSIRASRSATSRVQIHASTFAGTGSGARPNILIYLVDTLRADHLGCYGYPRPTSPHMDEFAADATRFERAVAQAPWTRPSVVSLLSGLYAQVHGVNDNTDAIPAGVALLNSTLAAAGYRTAAVVTNPHITPTFGFARGFDIFEYLEAEHEHEVSAQSDAVNERAFALLDELSAGEQPFFLYLHTMDPHGPYTPREPWRRRFAPGVDDPDIGGTEQQELLRRTRAASPELLRDLIALYDAEIAQNDASFGALVAGLKARGLYESAAILLVSDHGESFLEHGFIEHGTSLYEEEVRIPFVLRAPGGVGKGRVAGEIARLIDVMPTLLEIAGQPLPNGLHGRSLLPFVGGQVGVDDEPATYSYLRAQHVEKEALWFREHKLIRTEADPFGGRRYALYDLMADPRELDDLAPSQPARVGGLMARIRSQWSRWRPIEGGVKVEVEGEIERQLRALGYF